MFYKGHLYVRTDNDEITELVYPEENWGNETGFPYFSIIQVQWGAQPSFRSKKLSQKAF